MDPQPDHETQEDGSVVEPDPASMRAALRLALLFHDTTPWTLKMAEQWRLNIGIIYRPGRSPEDASTDVTTKVLCDAVRFALQPRGDGDGPPA